jgi:hypothetical protein
MVLLHLLGGIDAHGFGQTPVLMPISILHSRVRCALSSSTVVTGPMIMISILSYAIQIHMLSYLYKIVSCLAHSKRHHHLWVWMGRIRHNQDKLETDVLFWGFPVAHVWNDKLREWCGIGGIQDILVIYPFPCHILRAMTGNMHPDRSYDHFYHLFAYWAFAIHSEIILSDYPFPCVPSWYITIRVHQCEVSEMGTLFACCPAYWAASKTAFRRTGALSTDFLPTV